MRWTGLYLVFFYCFVLVVFFNQDPVAASLIMPSITMTNTNTNTNINWCIKLLQIHRSVHHLFGLYWDHNCWKKMHSMFKRFSKWSQIRTKTIEFLAGQIGKPLKMHDENVTSTSFNSNVTTSHYPIIIVRATTGLLMWTHSLHTHVLHTNMCWMLSRKWHCTLFACWDSRKYPHPFTNGFVHWHMKLEKKTKQHFKTNPKATFFAKSYY